MTIATSGMEPFRILFDGFQTLALTDRGVTRGFFLSVAGVIDRHPNFIVYLIVRFYLRSVDDTRVHIFIYRLYIYIFIQTGVICWADEGPKCKFFLIFTVEWICWAEEG